MQIRLQQIFVVNFITAVVTCRYCSSFYFYGHDLINTYYNVCCQLPGFDVDGYRQSFTFD